MDILKDKTFNDYDYTCRYSTVPYYYNSEDEKYIYGISKNMLKELPFVYHTLKDTDTLDSLALKYYNNPTYYWVIAYFNDIPDAFINLYEEMSSIRIPNISSISFGDAR